jgi:tetratricopeptide (TPR) repeat protein
MLGAAERGTLRPDRKGFNQATVPPGLDAAPEENDDGDRVTEPDPIPSSIPPLVARLKTPRAPAAASIPRAPLLPRFTPREHVAPSYAPPPEPELSPDDLELASADSLPAGDTVSAPPPSSSHTGFSRISSPPPLTVELSMLDGVEIPALEVPHAPPSSAPAAPFELSLASPFEIATWLAEKDFERALRAVQRLGADSSPELSVLEVRALVGLGRKAAARRALERLCRAPLLEPEVRGAVARLLVELGDLDRAEAQARRALSEEPRSESVRLTLAWAIVRRDAWLPSARVSAELAELLREATPESSSLPALAHALIGLTKLGSSLETSRRCAEAALTLDADSQDALALAAIVAREQGRAADAKRLHRRLLDLDHHAAEELSASLAALEEGRRPRPEPPPPSSRREPPPRSVPPLKRSPWEEKELRLALGDGKAALFDFEQGLARRLEALPARSGSNELSTAAMITARYLTEAPVSRHFSPFDLSLFSISRLDVALGLLYRGGIGPRTELRTRVLLGLGAYSGECLRQAYAGEWVGGSVDLLKLHVEGQGLCFSPFRDMNARLQSGQALEVGDTPLPHPGAEPLGQRVSLSLAPPTPWDPEPWPSVGRLPELGARLRESPVGLYCAGVELPLDLSFASLRSLDRYVTLLAPPLAPSDPEAGWVRRAAIFVGAYVGEVLRATHGGEWEPTRGELRPEAYRLGLRSGVQASPVASAFERLSGRRLEQPSDYARRITG